MLSRTGKVKIYQERRQLHYLSYQNHPKMTSDIAILEIEIGQKGPSEITEVPIDPSVEDVYSPSLESVTDFCNQNGIEVTQFFKSLWAIVVRQCLANGSDKFGFLDLRSEQSLQASETVIEIVQTSICDEIKFASFLASQHQQQSQQELKPNIPAHSTSMVLLHTGAEWEFTTWCEKQVVQKVRPIATRGRLNQRSNDL